MKSNIKKKKSEKSNQNIPNHIAIIMDGNGRWAQKRGFARIEGHRASRKAIRESVEGSLEQNVPFLSLFAFSTENWSRPKNEIEAIFKIFTVVLKEETPELHEKGVKIIVSGSLERFPPYLKKEMLHSMKLTVDNKNLLLNICLDYSGKTDLLQVVKKIHAMNCDEEEITEELIEQNLLTYPCPPVDLLIRTSGEQRISNFMLWQIAYAEFFFSDLFWPDFSKEELLKAITVYQGRDRRFGGVS
jgi:undecaprenyl diphosphate synthase